MSQQKMEDEKPRAKAARAKKEKGKRFKHFFAPQPLVTVWVCFHPFCPAGLKGSMFALCHQAIVAPFGHQVSKLSGQ